MRVSASPLQQEVVDGQGNAEQQDQRQPPQRHSSSPASPLRYFGVQHFQWGVGADAYKYSEQRRSWQAVRRSQICHSV